MERPSRSTGRPINSVARSSKQPGITSHRHFTMIHSGTSSAKIRGLFTRTRLCAVHRGPCQKTGPTCSLERGFALFIQPPGCSGPSGCPQELGQAESQEQAAAWPFSERFAEPRSRCTRQESDPRTALPFAPSIMASESSPSSLLCGERLHNAEQVARPVPEGGFWEVNQCLPDRHRSW